MGYGDRRPDQRALLALARNPLFAPLNTDNLHSLVARGQLHRYRSRALIVVQGDPADEVFCVVEGRVSVYGTSPDGRQQLYALLNPGELFGELGVLGDMPRSGTVESLEDCTLWGVSGSVFLEFLADHPEVARALMGALARQVVEMDTVVEDLLFLDVKGRIAKRLLALADQSPTEASGEGIVLQWELSQTQLASFCGTTRENMSRVLAEFQRRGLVERRGRRYVLRDLQTLRRLAGL